MSGTAQKQNLSPSYCMLYHCELYSNIMISHLKYYFQQTNHHTFRLIYKKNANNYLPNWNTISAKANRLFKVILSRCEQLIMTANHCQFFSMCNSDLSINKKITQNQMKKCLIPCKTMSEYGTLCPYVSKCISVLKTTHLCIHMF